MSASTAAMIGPNNNILPDFLKQQAFEKQQKEDFMMKKFQEDAIRKQMLEK